VRTNKQIFRWLTTRLPATHLLHRILSNPSSVDELLADEPSHLLGSEEADRKEVIDHLLYWGGMPGLLPLTDENRRIWLQSYQQTHLERICPIWCA
jgi:hypothetical protein